MQQLIGDFFRESYRLNDPFYIHYGVYCPKQSQVESKMRIKSQIVENQGRSGFLLRLLPELPREIQEIQSLRMDLKNGARIFHSQLSAGIWSDSENICESAQNLDSIFRINGFDIAENGSVHPSATSIHSSHGLDRSL